jgi:hypothetical protein
MRFLAYYQRNNYRNGPYHTIRSPGRERSRLDGFTVHVGHADSSRDDWEHAREEG